MRLQPDDAVHHLRAHRFQALGPVDVGLLVEPGLQLHDDHHFLAAAHGFDQQVHQHGVGAGAVDGLLDREHVGVVHGLAQELHHRLETLERMVQQHVAAAQPLQDALAARQSAQRPRRLVRREAQPRRAVPVFDGAFGRLLDQLRQAHEVHRAVDAIQRVVGQRELLQQHLRQLGRAAAHDLQPDGLPEVAGGQAAAQRMAQVGHVVLVDLEVRVARDAELRERLHRAVREQLVQVGTDHAGQQHEALAAAAQLVGQADHARQHARHLDDGDAVLAPERIAPAQAHDEVQRLVGHQRKRMRRVQAHRHQQRPHFAFEEARDPAPLSVVAPAMADDDDAGRGQRRHDLVVEDAVLVGDQRMRGGSHGLRVARRDARAGHAREFQHVGVADLEELVEVRRHDGDVAQALEHRHVGALRLRQHAAVELEDRTLSAKQRQFRRRVHGRLGGHPGHGASV
jgi:hypothetical protein